MTNKPFIFTHIAIFMLTLCTLINYLRDLRHYCCDGGLYVQEIIWYLGMVMFFSFMMFIFDILTLIKNKKIKEEKKDDM